MIISWNLVDEAVAERFRDITVRAESFKLSALKRTTVDGLGDGWAEGNGLLAQACLKVIALWLCGNISVPGTPLSVTDVRLSG